MKNIVMTYEAHWGKQPSWHTVKEYGIKNINNAYFDLARRAEKKGMKFYLSAFEWFNKNKFTKGWVVENNRWKQTKDIKPDLVFDKTALRKKYTKLKRFFSKKDMILNPFFIEELCSDKFKTFKLFPRLTPRLYLIKNKNDLKKNMKKIRSDLAVLKPRAGSSAHGLYIEEKEKIVKRKIKGDYILQEYVDTTKGIKGLTKGVHDIRIIIIDGKIVDSSMRVQKKGLISNISRGGKLIRLSKRQTPAHILKAAKDADKKLREYSPRMYAADFVLDENRRAWLIEMNSKVGFPFYNEKIISSLIDTFEKGCKK